MPATSHFDIYKASAGSGKTFSLTVQYLQLVINRPNAYQRILAVTFTNKATAEMKERILQVLLWLATRQPQANAYEEALRQALPHLSPAQIGERAGLVYKSILHDYSRFSIQTIDAFVQRIIRNFAWELGIDGGFTLQMNNDVVKEDLAQRLFLLLDVHNDLQKWVVEMAIERLDEGKRWEFHEDMQKLAEELFKEKFKDFENALIPLGTDEVSQRFALLQKNLYAFLKTIEAKWKRTAQQALDLIDDAQLSPADFAHGAKGFVNYFIKATETPMAEPGKRVMEAIAEPEKMLAKSAPADVKAKAKNLLDPLSQLLGCLVNWYNNDLTDFNTSLAIRRNLGLLRLMKVFADELAAYRKENNALLISDTHFLLMKLTQETSASFIYEKTGQQYQHFLIDEFQDTSVFQWRNFLPLLSESLSNGHYNLIVGDVKQAIYRWRNGDWRLLLDQAEKDLQMFAPNRKTLQENYRSARQIIEFNNLIFFVAPALIQEGLNALLDEAPQTAQIALSERGYFTVFNDAYSDAFQLQPATAPANGMACIRWLATEDDKSFSQLALESLHQQIMDLLAEGFEPADMAVLVRTNSEARQVVEFLSANQQDNFRYPIVSADALLISGNRAVSIIISALQGLLDVHNSIAMAQLRYLLMLEKGEDANQSSVFMPAPTEVFLPDAYLRETHRLSTLPLQELVHQLIMIFGLHKEPKHRAYLLALADVVKQFVRMGEPTLIEFMQYWNEEGCKKALPAKGAGEALEVTTIHKSKGLAYRIVLMPFLHWDLMPNSFKAPTLWVNNSHTPFNDIPVVPVRYKKDLALSHFSVEYFEEIVLTAMDNLNLTYVAFTRARQRLYAWAPAIHNDNDNNTPAENEKNEFPANVGALMTAVAKSTLATPGNSYADTRQSWNEEEGVWQHGVPEPPSNRTEKPAAQESQEPTYTHWKGRVTMRQSQLSEQPEESMSLPHKVGTLLHEVLSRMENPSQMEKVLQSMHREGWLEESTVQKLRNQLEPLLVVEALKPWHEAGWKRLAERNKLTETRALKRPDLVLYNQNSCIVYDFKFTQTEEGLPKHTEQMKEYLLLLRKMGFNGVQGFLIYAHGPKAIRVNA